MNMFYTLEGDDHRVVPCDAQTWRGWYGDEGQPSRVVARTHLGDGLIMVSTVFLGLDARALGDGPPLVFETLIFVTEPDHQHWRLDKRGTWRWPTWEEAAAGHQRVLREVGAAVPDPADDLDVLGHLSLTTHGVDKG